MTFQLTTIRAPIALALLFAINCAYAAPGPTSTYVVTSMKVTDLGTMGGAESEARDINNLGQIVGGAQRSDGQTYPFIYTGGLMRHVAGSGFNFPGVARGINNYSEIIGQMYVGKRAFYVYGDWLTVLPDSSPLVPSDTPHAGGFALNDYGHFVGHVWTESAFDIGENAAYWSSPSATPDFLFADWGVLSTPYAINNTNHIVGYYAGLGHGAFHYYNGAYVDIPTPISHSSISSSSAYGTNNQNRVTGYYSRHESDGQYHVRAFIWTVGNTSSTFINQASNSISSIGFDINDLNFIVGEVELLGPFLTTTQGFIYHNDFGMVTLPALTGGSRVQLAQANCRAYALNDRKSSSGLIQVVGYCSVGGAKHAMRWDVVVDTVTSGVPVPDTP